MSGNADESLHSNNMHEKTHIDEVTRLTRKKQISILVTGSINFGSIVIISMTLFNSVLFQLRLWQCQVDTISGRNGRVDQFLLEKLHLHNTQTGSPQNNENLCLPVENITVLVLRNKVAKILGPIAIPLRNCDCLQIKPDWSQDGATD